VAGPREIPIATRIELKGKESGRRAPRVRVDPQAPRAPLRTQTLCQAHERDAAWELHVEYIVAREPEVFVLVAHDHWHPKERDQ
jgi:hypothetical protein